MKEVEKVKALAEKVKDEAKKAKDEVKQHVYDVRVAKIEDALRAEVPAVCRTYCALVWDEALNQARVEASSVLRKVENDYYPPTIHPLSSLNSKVNPASSEVGDIQGSLPKIPVATNTHSEGAEEAEDTSKIGEINKNVVQGFGLPPIAPKDPLKEKETSQSMELVLATLTVPRKEDPKDKAKASSMATSTQLLKDLKEKLIIKIKQ